MKQSTGCDYAATTGIKEPVDLNLFPMRISEGQRILDNRRSQRGNGYGPLRQIPVGVLAVSFLLLATAVILGWVVVPCVIRAQIANKVAISPEINPELFSAWIHPPVPVFLRVFVFNVTNPKDVVKGALPQLQEVGPFVFRENRTKVLLDDSDAERITYKEHISYHFELKLSAGNSLDDRVTIINVPFAAAAIKIAEDLFWPIQDLAEMALLNLKEPLFVTKTVEEALFKGWAVPFLEKIEEVAGFSPIPGNRFGFFIGQNDTAQGPYTVSRGITDKASFGRILSFKNHSELDHWVSGSECNKLKGTDGAIFPPFVSRSSVLTIFNAEMCRSLSLTFEKDTEYGGIRSFKFTAPPSLLKDPRKSEENWCYCVQIQTKPETCLKQGTLDLGPCREGAPVALSTPHFLDGDQEYVNMSGLNPDRSQHETFMIVEPLTGLILNASKKIQVNLVLKRAKGIPSKVTEMLFPLVWADECAELDSENLEKFKSALRQLWIVDFVSKWGLLTLSILVSLVLIIRKLRLIAGNKRSSNGVRGPDFVEVADCDHTTNLTGDINVNNEDKLRSSQQEGSNVPLVDARNVVT